MSAGFRDASGLKNHDPVGPLDRRQAVRDDQGGAIPHQRRQRRLDVALRFAVERRGGLVENQDRGVLQERTGDRQALPLSAGQPHAVLADEGRQPLRHFPDELHRMCGLGGRDDFGVTRPGQATVRDIGGHAVVEENHFLAYQGDVRSQAGEPQLGNVDPVHQYLAAVGRVEARQEIGQRRLARARGADQGHSLARAHRKRDPLERGSRGSRIGKTHIAEFQIAAGAPDLASPSVGLRGLVHDVEYAFRCGETALHRLVHASQASQRRQHQQHRRQKRHEPPHRGLVRRPR